MPVEKIKMYGTRVCPDCSRAKQVLSKNQVAYDWIDIEQDETACVYVEKVNKGYKSVPTIVFPDGTILVEPSNLELETKLKSINSNKG